MRARLWLFVACWLLLAAPLRAQDLQSVPPLSGRVIDLTGTLTSAQVQALSGKLEGIERQRGSQIVVLVVASTQPEDIAAYAQRVGDQWKIGRPKEGDGLLIVVAKNDRRVRIEVAKGLEGAVPDLAANQIITDRITPAFRKGDYAGGLNSAVDRLAERIGSEGLAEPSQQATQHVGSHGMRGFDLHDLGIFFFVGVPILGAVLTSVMGRKLGALATGGAAGGVGWWLTTSAFAAGGAGLIALLLVGVFGFGSRRGGGSGMPVVWGSGGFGGEGGGRGGGFSSGGGGDFGGGGSSGSW